MASIVSAARLGSALSRAAQAALSPGSPEFLQKLASQEAEARKREERRTLLSQMTALGYACYAGELELVKWLVEVGDAQVNQQDSAGCTPVLQAVRGNHVDIVTFLIAKGAHTHVKDQLGRSALSIGAANNAVAAIEFLLRNNKVAMDDDDLNGMQAIHHAAENGHKAALQTLIDLGNANVDSVTSTGRTALMLSSMCGYLDCVQWLVAMGAKLESKDEEGITAAMFAAANQHYELLAWLVNTAGASIESQDKQGWTALMSAARDGTLPLVEYLAKELKCNLNGINGAGRTALMEACIASQFAVVKLLHENGASIELEDNDGRDALTLATELGHWEIVEFLTDASRKPEDGGDRDDGRDGAGKDDVDGDGKALANWNSIMKESEASGLSVVAYLTRERRVDELNLVDRSGRTFLMHAALYGKLPAVRSLVEEGYVDITVRCVSKNAEAGKTAMHLALSKKWFHIYLYLFVRQYVHYTSIPVSSGCCSFCLCCCAVLFASLCARFSHCTCCCLYSCSARC